MVSILESAKESARSAISFLIELSHRAQAATGSIVGLFIQVYDGHVKYHVKPIVDAGQARYNRVVAPLFEEINTKSKALFMEIHLTVNSLFDRFVFQFSRSCPPILSLVDNLGKRTKFRLLREGQKNLESLCLDAKGTSVFILELLGVVLGFVFAFVLRRHLLVLSLGVIRLLLWPIQVLGSMVLSPFAFLCRFPMKLLRLFPRSAREFETEQVDSCGEQSDELTEGDKVGRQ